MSTYLLLRNNQESGPFTLEEMKGMLLKSYDLIWVVGKSAAWRYPIEIAELKSFAPAIPEQQNDTLYKKYSSGTIVTESSVGRSKDSSSQYSNSRAVYINMPAHKPPSIAENSLQEPIQTDNRGSSVFPDMYKGGLSGAAKYSGKILWISTIILLFGAGILTGLFISDRREFFSKEVKHPEASAPIQSAVSNSQKTNIPVETSYSPPVSLSDRPLINMSSLSAGPNDPKKPVTPGKKKINTIKKDSSASQAAALTSFTRVDSSKLTTVNKTDLLFRKIKANPENYISIVAGHYSTGILGGISSFPVTITNNSPVVMDEVMVKVDYIQSNDKVYKSAVLTFNDLQPGETVSVKAPKSSRGTKVSSNIRSIISRKLDLTFTN